MKKRISMMICAFALAITASADVRNIRPPTTGEGKLGTTTYKWGEVNALKGVFSSLWLDADDITDLFISPADANAGEVFYADGVGSGVWDAAQSPTSGISQAVADVLYPRKTDLGSAAYSETNDFATAAEGDIAASLAYPWYGVSWTTNQSNPNLTRTGNLGMHKTLPIQEKMYACVLSDAGEEVYILDGDDWTKTDFGYASNLDGTDGQVMIHLPEFYFDAWTNAGVITWAIAPEPLVGFEKMPEQYVSAFEASCYRAAGVTTNLCSVINTNTAYRGGNNTAAWDGTASNLLGMAATNLSRPQMRTYARARGTGWEMYNYLAHRSITTLFTVEYATKNSQKAVNLALDSNGFKQGGLGDGVTTVAIAAWGAFNGSNPFVPCGTAISLASGTGEVEYTLPAAFSNTVSSVMVPVYRGIENPFGHIWEICDGINLQIFADGEVDPSSYAWISNDPDTWNDANYTGYLNTGKLPRTEGYVTSMLLGHILPSSVGSSSATYWCDKFYTTLPESGSRLRIGVLGGASNAKTELGLGCLASYMSPTSAYSTTGTRLCYFPQN